MFVCGAVTFSYEAEMVNSIDYLKKMYLLYCNITTNYITGQRVKMEVKF